MSQSLDYVRVFKVQFCAMRGSEAASCLSVLGADRHRKGQTCVSMAMSGCSPFPMCWVRGMNESSLKHTQKHTESIKTSQTVTFDSMGTDLVYSQSYHEFAETLIYCGCVRTFSTPIRCNYLVNNIRFLLMEENYRKDRKKK